MGEFRPKQLFNQQSISASHHHSRSSSHLSGSGGQHLIHTDQRNHQKLTSHSSGHSRHQYSSHQASTSYHQGSSKRHSSVGVSSQQDVAKKAKENFMEKMSKVVVTCLNVHLKSDCKIGRIRSSEDFKYLARKLVHFIVGKELKKTKKVEKLRMSSEIESKATNYVKSYMNSLGPEYKRHLAKSPK